MKDYDKRCEWNIPRGARVAVAAWPRDVTRRAGALCAERM